MNINLKNNYFLILLANLIQAFSSWLMLLFIIHLGHTKDVGLFSFIQASLIPVQLFFTLKLRTIQSADFNELYKASEYHFIRKTCSLISFSISCAILTLTTDDRVGFWAGIFLSISYSIHIIRETIVTVLINKNEFYHFFLINLSNSFLGVLGFCISYYTTNNIAYAILWMTIAKIISYFAFEKIIFFSKVPDKLILEIKKIKPEKAYQILKTGIPLGLTALITAIFTSIPQIQIKNNMGYDSLGAYAAITSVLVAFNLLVNSFSQSALPNLAKDYSENKKYFFLKVKKSILLISAFSLLSLFIVMFFGKYVLLILFGSQYSSYETELNLTILCGFALALFSLSNLILSAQKTFFLQLPLYILCAILIFLLTENLIPKFGINGALISQTFAYLSSFFIALIIFIAKYRNTKLLGI